LIACVPDLGHQINAVVPVAEKEQIEGLTLKHKIATRLVVGLAKRHLRPVGLILPRLVHRILLRIEFSCVLKASGGPSDALFLHASPPTFLPTQNAVLVHRLQPGNRRHGTPHLSLRNQFAINRNVLRLTQRILLVFDILWHLEDIAFYLDVVRHASFNRDIVVLAVADGDGYQATRLRNGSEILENVVTD